MAIKQRAKAEASFSMSSMTDIVFLLLIFFLVTSTLINPNALKLLLPKSTNQIRPNNRLVYQSNIIRKTTHSHSISTERLPL